MTMSYQQTTNPEARSSNMYTQPRSNRDTQGQAAPFHQGAAATPQHDPNMASIINHFTGLGVQTTNMTSAGGLGAGQMQIAANQYFVTADGQLLMAPASLYPQPMGAAGMPDNSYGAYPALPYFAPTAYPGYIPGYSMMPYTPGRAGYYTDRSDQSHKEVPALENRRGSYSTNESAPGTPFYGAASLPVTQIATDRSPFGSTPSPQQLTIQHADQQLGKPLHYKSIPINVDLDALLAQLPAIPRAVPAVFTPRESMRTLDQSLSNPMHGNRNVYIRGLHPNTDDETLAAYAARFGRIETSKAIIDTATGACKGFGFAKYFHVRDSELCIRGFYKLGYEVGFARESFNSRLKAEGDETSTNLYVSNLPKSMTESELGAIFMDYTVSSSRILRDNQNNSRGVGFARFESREICEEIIRKFHGQAIGDEGLLLQVRYADTPAQKDLKRITTERRQFRTNEYNVGAYGAPADLLGMATPGPSPLGLRTSQLHHHVNARFSGAWKRDTSRSSTSTAPNSKDHDRQVKVSVTYSSPKGKEKAAQMTPTISEDGSTDDGITVHCDSPVVASGGSANSPTARKS